MAAPSSVSGTSAQIRATVATNANWQTFTTAGGQAIPPLITFSVTTGSTNTSTTLRMVSYNVTARATRRVLGSAPSCSDRFGNRCRPGQANRCVVLAGSRCVVNDSVASLMNNTFQQLLMPLVQLWGHQRSWHARCCLQFANGCFGR